MRLLREQLERMGQPPTPEPQPPPIPQHLANPQAFLEYYQPAIDAAVREGWIDPDQAALYPMDQAFKIHLWQTLRNGTQRLEEAHQFTRTEQERRQVDEASRTLDSAIDEVAGRGEMFEALRTGEVRQGFRDFLIDEVNPRLSQITPDFLARQFYAYNHELIYNTVRQGGGQASPQQGATPAQLARQEGSSTRAAATAVQAPEFADLLEGTPYARWYQ